MAGRAVVDTSALLAIANPRDQYHGAAVAAAQRFIAAGGRWVGTPLVLAELHTHLVYRRGAATARAVTIALLDDPAYQWIEVRPALLREATSRWIERFADQDFTLTDAVSFEVMRRERLRTAFAYDQHFVTAGYTLL